MRSAVETRRDTTSDPFGFYNFTEIPFGAVYVFVVVLKRDKFVPRVAFRPRYDLSDFIASLISPFGRELSINKKN